MTEQDLIYAAATIDCEGSITIVKHMSIHGNGGNKWYELRSHVSMTKEAIPKWLKQIFGGNYGHYQQRNPRYSDFYMWYLSSTKAAEFIALILPYLKLKQSQAEVALQFDELMRKLSYKTRTLEEREAEQNLKKQMGVLNKRGKV